MKKYLQLIPVLLTLIIGISISIWIHFKEKEEILQAKNKEFTNNVTIKTNAIRNELTNTFSSVEILQYFFQMNNPISREEFKNYTIPILTINPGIKAISWVPKIDENNRLKFTKKIHNEIIIKNFSITELNRKNEFTKSSKRTIYFAVEYIEPIIDNINAVGYDIYSNEKRKLTIDDAIRSKKLKLTPIIKLKILYSLYTYPELNL